MSKWALRGRVGLQSATRPYRSLRQLGTGWGRNPFEGQETVAHLQLYRYRPRCFVAENSQVQAIFGECEIASGGWADLLCQILAETQAYLGLSRGATAGLSMDGEDLLLLPRKSAYVL